MQDALVTHFVDGYAEFDYLPEDRSMRLVAFDVATQNSYLLQFEWCHSVTIEYRDEEWDADRVANLHDLNDGVSEIESGEANMRRFLIDFDDVLVDTTCRRFSVRIVEKHDWPWLRGRLTESSPKTNGMGQGAM